MMRAFQKRRWFFPLVVAAAVGFVCCAGPCQVQAADMLPTLLAQADAGAGAAKSDGGAKIVTTSRSYVFDIVIIAAVFSLALFTICKSSNRA
jgi:hypothetical protein